MESEEAALRGMLAAGVRLLEVARAQDPAMPAHILAAIEETCTDLRARLCELGAGSP
jgi:hypothetical protein